MMRKSLIFVIFLVLSSFLFGQKEAIIIKHIGEQDKSIKPLLISNYVAGEEISDYLKAHKWSNPRATDTSIVDTSFFSQLRGKWNDIIPKDEKKFSGLFGSFVVMWINNDSIVRKIDLNHRDQSLLFFYKLSDSIKKFEKFKGKYTVLNEIRKRICRMYMEEENCDPPQNNMK